jgi:hypothetical protein
LAHMGAINRAPTEDYSGTPPYFVNLHKWAKKMVSGSLDNHGF